MKVVYIVGPFRAPTAWQVEQNIRRAEEVALEVWQRGFACICPHTNTRFFNGAYDDEVFLDGAKETMLRCDIALALPTWQFSQGSIQEIALAHKEGIPVVFSIDQLIDYKFPEPLEKYEP